MAYFKHTPDQIQEFKVIFDQLTTIEEKLVFWKDTLGIPFSFYTLLMDSDQFNADEELVNVFYFNPPRGEQEKLNCLILEEIQEFDSMRPVKQLINYETLKAELNEKLSAAKRPLALLDKEMVAVDEWIENNTAREINYAASFDLKKIKSQIVKNIWTMGFEDSYLYKKEFGLARVNHSAGAIIAYYNGYYSGELKAYIEEKLKNPTIKKVSAQNKPITLKQQLLLLEHSGLLAHISTWKQQDKDKFLGAIIDKSPDKISQVLPNIDDRSPAGEIWTITNLEFLTTFFTGLDLSDKEAINKRVKTLEKGLEELKLSKGKLKSEK